MCGATDNFSTNFEFRIQFLPSGEFETRRCLILSYLAATARYYIEQAVSSFKFLLYVPVSTVHVVVESVVRGVVRAKV